MLDPLKEQLANSQATTKVYKDKGRRDAHLEV